MESRRIAESTFKRHGPTKLLDDGDLNIGNAQTLIADTNVITKPITNPPRILNLDADSKFGSVVTIGLAASAKFDPGIQGGSAAGPLTAVLEFGNGSVFTDVEIDVPIGQIGDFTNPSTAQDGVVVCNVPAGTLRVYGRHDGNLITPSIGNTFGSPTAAAGQSNTPVGAGPWDNNLNDVPIPAFMKAFAVYEPFATLARRCTKTIYVYNGFFSGVSVAVPLGTRYWVPAFARSVQVYRNTIVSATAPTNVTLQFINNITQVVEQYTIPGGTNSPIFQLGEQIIAIGVSTDGVINTLSLVFDIGL